MSSQSKQKHFLDRRKRKCGPKYIIIDICELSRLQRYCSSIMVRGDCRERLKLSFTKAPRSKPGGNNLSRSRTAFAACIATLLIALAVQELTDLKRGAPVLLTLND